MQSFNKFKVVAVFAFMIAAVMAGCGGGGGGGATTSTTTGGTNDDATNSSVVYYTLLLSVSPSATSGTLTATPDSVRYAANTVVSLNAAPASGCKFKKWDGDSAVDVVDNKILMNSNKSVTAVFEAATTETPVTATYTLSLSVSPTATSGTVTASPAGPTYSQGTVVTLSYSPYLGNRFVQWDGTNAVDVASNKITMNSDKAVSAKFESSAAATAKTIYVDASAVLGAFTMTVGSHNGPVALVSGADESAKYRELGFKNIRTIDYYGPFTWYNCFPDFTKDADSEDSYDFSTTDVRVNKLVGEGFEILFNFGPSWTDPVHRNTADPPGTIRNASGAVTHAATVLDFQKFANVAKHIVMHYNDGWKSGYRYNIKRWELWNEPETNDKFWTGTPMQFFQMYCEVAKTLKAYNAGLILYGPGNAETIPPTNPHTADPNTYTRDFMQYCRDNGAAIDVYTWHSYGGTAIAPSHIKTVADDVRAKLDSCGFNSTLSSCDEWNSGINEANFANSGKGAAYYGCALTFMTEKNIAESYQYRGDDHPLGILRDPGGDYKTAAYALIAWKQMTSSCSRLSSSTSETGEFAVIASKSSSDGTYYAMASNFTAESKTMKLIVANISSPPAKGWTLTRKVINDTQKLESAESGTIASDTQAAYTFTLPSYSVAFIQMTPAQ